jgi:hypothetical protein
MMNSAVSRARARCIAFSAGRFELHLHPSLFAVPLPVGLAACLLAGQLSWAALAAACAGHLAILVLHEAAHAGVAAALGSRRIQVWLGGLAGVCVPALPPTVGVGGLLLLLSAGWWAQLTLAGVAGLLLQLPDGPWTPAVAALVLVWLPWNGVRLVKSMLPIGASDGAQVLAVLRALRAEWVRRSG